MVRPSQIIKAKVRPSGQDHHTAKFRSQKSKVAEIELVIAQMIFYGIWGAEKQKEGGDGMPLKLGF